MSTAEMCLSQTTVLSKKKKRKLAQKPQSDEANALTSSFHRVKTIGCRFERCDITTRQVSPFMVVIRLSHPPHRDVVSRRSVACFITTDESVLPSPND